MKKFTILFLSCLVFSSNVLAYVYVADDFEEGSYETKESANSKTKDFIKKSFSGSVNHAQLMASDENERAYTSANLRFDNKYKGVRLVLDGLYEKVDISFQQTLESQGVGGGAAETRTLTHSRSKVRPNDAYVAWDVNNYFTLSGGLKRITWGQFEPFSPVNFAFPMNVSSTGITFSKLKSAIPQEFVGLEVFPTSWISLESYYMPSVRVDDLMKGLINDPGDNFVVADENFDEVNQVETLDTARSDYFHNQNWESEDQFGARVMFYPDWGSFGFSYFDGYQASFGETRFSEIGTALDARTGDVFAFSQDGVGGFSGIEQGDNFFFNKSAQGLAEQKMIGFEMSVPVNKFTWKFEFARFESQYSLEDYSTSDMNHFLNGKTPVGFSGNAEAASEFFNFVKDDNAGKFYIPYHYNIAALGFDADLERWLINFTLYAINEEFDSKYQQLLNNQKEAYPHLNNDDSSGEVFPMLNIARYLDYSKTGMVGVAGGIIGNGMGFALYYNQEFKEAFTLGLALVSMEYFSDDVIEDSGNGDTGVTNTTQYKKTSDTSNGVVFSLGYKF